MKSVVVPLHNEEESLVELTRQVTVVFNKLNQPFELIYINDGSTDNSAQILAAIQAQFDFVKVITFRRNSGKAAALDAGFKSAKGDIVITMDADLQDDPGEIPRFLEEINKGFDLVNGWKKRRKDPLDKVLPSFVFNFLVRKFTGVHLKDINCGMKAYRKEAIENIHLYGEMHRFIPALVSWQGFEVTEIPIHHRPRLYGQSKYGARRFVNGILDLLTVQLTTRFSTKPLHFFGRVGLLSGLIGSTVLAYLSVLWFLDLGPIGTRPLFAIGIFLCLAGLQFIGIGLLAELIVKNRNVSERNLSRRQHNEHQQLSKVSNI